MCITGLDVLLDKAREQERRLGIELQALERRREEKREVLAML